MAASVCLHPQAVLAWSPATDSGRHAHRALQLVCALQAPCALEREPTTAAETLDWAVLPPLQPHRLRGSGQPLAHLFVDIGPRAWQRWLRAGGAPRRPDPELLAALRADGPPDPELPARWRRHSLPGLVDDASADPRIASARRLIDADPSSPQLGHRQLATAVHLSPSRFIALFRTHAGMPVRNYVLWRRLQLAAEQVLAGASITQAAHASGFSDAAHLSRSFRQILGAAPSELVLPLG